MRIAKNTQLFIKHGFILVNSKKQPFGYATAGAVTFALSSITGIGAYSVPLNILVFSILYVLYSAVYLYNDIIDLDIDRINSKDRPLVGGDVNLQEAKRLVILLFVISISLTIVAGSITFATIDTSYCLSLPLSSPKIMVQGLSYSHEGKFDAPEHHNNNLLAIFLTVVLSVLLGIMYSHPKIYLKKRFPFKSISLGLAGALSSLVGWAISGGTFSPHVLLSVLSTTSFIFVLSIIFDLRDVKGDALHNVKTFPIVLGIPASYKIMSCALALPLAISIATISFTVYANISTMAVMAMISIFGIRALTKIRDNLEDKRTFFSNVITLRRLYYLMQIGLVSSLVVDLKTGNLLL